MRASARGALAVVWTLACAASALAGDAFELTTPGSPGTGGAVPTLAGEGAASPGSKNSLLLDDTLPHAPALLVFSVSELAAPFAGGVLGPAPDFLAALGITDADGALEKRFRVPENAPVGLELWLQAWVRDAGGAAGFAASNTLKVTVRPEVPVELIYPAAILELDGGVSDIAAGDLDADGRDELVVARSDPTGVRVLRNVGDGLFEDPYQILQGAANAVRLGDLNGDGATDVVVGMQAMPRVNVLLGDGAGGFSEPIPFAVPAIPTHVWLADLDGDAVLDLVASHFGSVDVSVFLGVGDGSFGVLLPHAPGGALASLTVADLDADGVPDLVGAVTPFVFPLQQYVAVSFGVGDGTFAEAVLTPTDAPTVQDIAVVDLDGDGHLDVVATKVQAEELSWHRGLGGGGLAPSQALLAGAQPAGLLAEDFDRDGVLDLAVANSESNDLAVFLVTPGSDVAPEPDLVLTGIGPKLLVALELQGDDCTDLAALNVFEFQDRELISLHVGLGDGGFHAASSEPLSRLTTGVALVDLDADGVLDVVTTRLTAGKIAVMLGEGGGAFGPSSVYDTESQSGALVVADLDGDGGAQPILSVQQGRLQVFDVAADGTLGGSTLIDVGVASIGDFRAGDLDADGDLDLIGSSGGESRFWVLLNSGAGAFDPPLFTELSHSVGGVTLHDLDGDGLLDVVFSQGSLGLHVHLNLGGATFSEGTPYPLFGSSLFGGATFAGDMNEDGVPDLVSTPFSGTAAAAVLLGLGDGSFGAAEFFESLAGTFPSISGSALADVDGDGHLDLVGVRTDLLIMCGDGAGALEPALVFGAGGSVGATAVADVDGDGAPDIVAKSSIPGAGVIFSEARLAVLRNLRAP